MPKVRAGADKWQRRASQAGADYAAGIQAPRRTWHEATQEAAGAWTDGVQQAIADNAFQRAATPQATQTWQQRSSTLGQQRYAPGVAASKDRYATGFAPYKAVIENTTLPPRGRRGDPNNYARSQAVGQALNDKRMQIRKGGS